METTKLNEKELTVLVSILNSVNLLASTHYYSDIHDIVENRLTPKEINFLHQKLADQLSEVSR